MSTNPFDKDDHPQPQDPDTPEGHVKTALRKVFDPEIGLNVVELGLIREINLNEDPAVVDMMMTTPFCPYAGWLVQQVKQESEPVAGKSVRVNVLPDVWDPSFMEDPGILSGWS
ncbi:MAG: metal-sulfur cluster assembly factor [Chloroflexi bacterium]|jgi:metal-sulfur cluster biosynthetic enzyme|nr:MAG: metal-sulfur cluster assembly factor [Chloroflexota bacterium]